MSKLQRPRRTHRVPQAGLLAVTSMVLGGITRAYGRRPLLRVVRVVPLAALTFALLLLSAGFAQASGLPDNRGYEQVTPANKDSGEPTLALFGTSPTPFAVSPAAGDGDRLAYSSFNAFPGSQSFGSYYMATRATSNWSSVNLIPPQSVEASLLCGALASDTPAYSHDLTTHILSDGFGQYFGCGTDDPPLVPNAFDSHQESRYSSNLFVHDNVTSAYYLVNITPPEVDANCPLMAQASNLCIAAFNAGSADLSHVVFDENTSPGLTADAPDAVDNLYEWVKGADSVRLVTYLPGETPAQGAIAGGSAAYAFHAVSDDGSKIFFVSGGNLYVRIDGTSTQQVDAPGPGAPGPGGGGQFVAASSDGSKAFFTDADTAGLTTDTQPGSGTNLYEYDVAADTLTDLTPGPDVAVQGFVGSSDDGSYIYFVADGALDTGAVSGQPNLYVIHNGGAPSFISTLAGTDSCDWTLGFCSSGARVSSNGLYLAFTSTQSLTGFNNAGFREVFLYSFASDQLSCASCSSNAEPPTSDTVINGPEQPLESFAGINAYLQRQVSNSGPVFFQTTEALLPSDSNGQQDIYEYHNGALSLLSAGTSPHQSMFWDASSSGNDVFFATYDQLVPQDTDGSPDLYDARVGGGFPASAPAPVCEGEGCKPPVSGQPAAPIAASVTFSGPGNATTPTTGGRIRLLRKRAIRGTRVRLLVKVPIEGDLTAGGRNLGSSSLSVPRAGQYVMTLKLTKKGRHALNRKRRLKLAIRVRFDPAVGKASTATVRLTMKAASRKAKR